MQTFVFSILFFFFIEFNFLVVHSNMLPFSTVFFSLFLILLFSSSYYSGILDLEITDLETVNTTYAIITLSNWNYLLFFRSVTTITLGYIISKFMFNTIFSNSTSIGSVLNFEDTYLAKTNYFLNYFFSINPSEKLTIHQFTSLNFL